MITGVIVYSAFSWGFVSHIAYGWFILPVFPTLPHFTVLQFVGFALFLSTIFRSSGSNIKDEYVDKSKFWQTIILAPWLALAMSWLLHLIFF